MLVNVATGEEGNGYATYNPSRKAVAVEQEKLQQEMDEQLKKLRERCKRTVLRKIDTGEVSYDQKRKIFILVETQ